jgi:hypothetical protein
MASEWETPGFVPLPARDGDDWHVHVTWPDGTEEDVCGFKSEIEANEWIKMESFMWLQLHPKIRHPPK